jgi:hypothetical protein
MSGTEQATVDLRSLRGRSATGGPREDKSAYSACLERLKKRKERIGWPVTTGTGIHGSGPGERLFLEGQVRVKVDLRSFHLLMTEPEGYDRAVYPSL